jgi:hypothetical protein
MKIRSHFKHNIFLIDEAGHLLEHLGGTDDYLMAAELYEVAVKPGARVRGDARSRHAGVHRCWFREV